MRGPLGYGQMAVPTGNSKDLAHTSAGAIPSNVAGALLQAEGANVRWRDDGTNPTETEGMLLVAGDKPTPYIGSQSDLARIKVTGAAAGAILNVSFYAMTG
jgi:hypothetical protein